MLAFVGATVHTSDWNFGGPSTFSHQNDGNFVVVAAVTTDADLTGASYNGISLTAVDVAAGRARMWAGVSTASGTNTASVATGGSATGIVAGAVSYEGVDPDAPVDGVSASGSGDTAPSVQVNSALGNLVVGYSGRVGGTGDTHTVGSGQTSRVNAGQSPASLAISDEPGDSLVTHSYTRNSGFFWTQRIAAFNLRAAIGAEPVEVDLTAGASAGSSLSVTVERATDAAVGAAAGAGIDPLIERLAAASAGTSAEATVAVEVQRHAVVPFGSLASTAVVLEVTSIVQCTGGAAPGAEIIVETERRPALGFGAVAGTEMFASSFGMDAGIDAGALAGLVFALEVTRGVAIAIGTEAGLDLAIDTSSVVLATLDAGASAGLELHVERTAMVVSSYGAGTGAAAEVEVTRVVFVTAGALAGLLQSLADPPLPLDFIVMRAAVTRNVVVRGSVTACARMRATVTTAVQLRSEI